jgi:tRNA modification GTPase
VYNEPVDKPIIALATPPLKGALAVIRTSGEGIFEITDRFFSKKVSGTKERGMMLGTFYDANHQTIDFVVLLVYPGPKTMTGEDIVEIIPHGSMVIVNQIIQAYIGAGCVYATRGEFSSRAFFNGKMDLIEAEAVNDLINATTVEAKNLAFLSLNGSTSKLVEPLKKEIADLLALVEVNIDYPEYTDIEQANDEKIQKEVKRIRLDIAGLIKSGREGQIIKEGVKVAIVGEPNVGKSSLLNALLGEEKAIVSDIPGTTRDVVEGELSIHGVALHLLDTAGIRSSKNKIEQLGVALSEKTIDQADVVILVLDAREKEPTLKEKAIMKLAAKKHLILCYNKDDLIAAKDPQKLYVSALKHDIEPLKEAIYSSLSLGEESFATPSLSNARELGLLKQIDSDLEQAGKDAGAGEPVDIVSVSLQSAYNGARQLLGEDITTDLTDEIFSRFCVGK